MTTNINAQERYISNAQSSLSTLLEQLTALDEMLTRTRLSVERRQQLLALRKSLQNSANNTQSWLTALQKTITAPRPMIPLLNITCH
ncbi:hypothetical protein [Secundilactobacillus similis]|uniref:Uncharacterized protein n=1 Tax=Secundilactobacillus similis DSM 23365 = JCM 2765 TaxID=1423804 RepID=A0A0R2EQV9_9LACO|nr:hypothetical protein [Secundilactobacillus similis]KRN15511.1 hypothetical protein FD14_GL002850 [Secundilactobacillus similis DSM 23365 = JCM 2765]